jgi:hypothetical protein
MASANSIPMRSLAGNLPLSAHRRIFGVTTRPFDDGSGLIARDPLPLVAVTTGELASACSAKF